MDIKIHRGLNQIGGCITEISTATSRVFIDMGQNLPGVGVPNTPEQDKAMVEGIFAQHQKEHEAVFYSHTHEDHIGLFWAVPDNVPQYLGEASKAIFFKKHMLIKRALQEKRERLEKSSPLYDLMNEKIQHKVALIKKIDQMRTWQRPMTKRSPKPLQVGDISLTPFYCCHSSFEAYMFLIEADGKRIWHTGDFRGHGYLSKGLYKTLETYARDIDTLIIEGTMLGRDEQCSTEAAISRRMQFVMQAFKNVFVLVSSTDMERLVSVKDAALKAKGGYRFDKRAWYMSWAMTYATHQFGKHFSMMNFDVKYVDLMGRLPSNGFVIPVNASQMERVQSALQRLNPSETLLIYSSWDGYYKDPEQVAVNPRYKQFRDMFDNVVDLHTSGHSDRKTLACVINTIHPKESIIGIHKEPDTSLKSLDISDELKEKVME